MSAPNIIVVTDETSPVEIAEAITHLAAYAKRQQHHPDCAAWTNAHARIDCLLEDWEARKADA